MDVMVALQASMHRTSLRSGHAGAGNRARLCLLGAALAVLLPAMARAGDVSSLTPQVLISPRPREVTVAVDGESRACKVLGRFVAQVPDNVAWAVLTDYDHLARFVSSLEASKVESRSGNHLTVAQDAAAHVFLFHRDVHVRLDVNEEPERRIVFRDTLGKDFRSYVGEWRVRPDSTGTLVEYQLAAEPRSAVPRSVCRGMLKRTAQSLLTEVRSEMLRRGGPGVPPGER